MHSQLIQKQWCREELILPSLDEDSSPWLKKKQAGATLPRHTTPGIDNIFVSTPLVRVKLTEDYLEMRKEHFLNGSDHRAVILHLDIESFLGTGPPRVFHDNVKIRIRAVTAARTKGKLIDTACAYTKELDAMLGKSPARSRPETATQSGSV